MYIAHAFSWAPWLLQAIALGLHLVVVSVSTLLHHSWDLVVALLGHLKK